MSSESSFKRSKEDRGRPSLRGAEGGNGRQRTLYPAWTETATRWRDVLRCRGRRERGCSCSVTLSSQLATLWLFLTSVRFLPFPAPCPSTSYINQGPVVNRALRLTGYKDTKLR